jgi:hypothetical protein
MAESKLTRTNIVEAVPGCQGRGIDTAGSDLKEKSIKG